MLFSKKRGAYFLMLIVFQFTACKRNTGVISKSISNTSHKKNVIKKIDSSSIDVLVRKNNKNIEDELLILKNAAFCLCMNKEQNDVIENDTISYKLITDNSLNGYAEYSNLELELFIRNESLKKLVDKWGEKQYESKPKEEKKDSPSYLINMKCLDFYNSTVLKKYIDSVGISKK